MLLISCTRLCQNWVQLSSLEEEQMDSWKANVRGYVLRSTPSLRGPRGFSPELFFRAESEAQEATWSKLVDFGLPTKYIT